MQTARATGSNIALQRGKRRRRLRNALLICALAFPGFACDPIPRNDFVPPGGFVEVPNATGKAAIRAVLYTPSHGAFRTVRQAVATYMGSATEAVKVAGWSATQVEEPDWPHYRVAFQWNDGHRPRSAEWELNHLGIWPVNDEARILSVFPPDPR